MRRVLLGILVPTTMMALGACSGDQGDVAGVAVKEPCGYDTNTLMPAMESAVPADATVRMTMEMSAPGHRTDMEATIAYTDTGVEMEMKSRTDGEEFALIVVDNRVFLSDSTNGAYEEVDHSDPAIEQFRSQAESADISTTFAAWRAGLREVTPVGEEEIAGERLCHYTLAVNAADAFAAQGEEVVPGTPETITYELYLTDDDLMRRVGFDLSGVKMEMNATNWNEPVEIAVPDDA